MRYALPLVAICLCACGGHHSSPPPDPHPPSAAFDPIVGDWTATCTQVAANLPVALNSTAAFTVDQRGHLTGLTSSGQTIDAYLTQFGTISRFYAYVGFSDGGIGYLQIDVPPTTPVANQQATLSKNSMMPAIWSIAYVGPPG